MPDKFRILSLDGGGIRGSFSAAFIAEIERRIGSPIAQYFDLVAGTSTGGIIALGLALGLPATRIEDLYRTQGSRIFVPRRERRASRLGTFCLRVVRKDLRVDWLFHSRYDNDGLRSVLQEAFGDRTIGDCSVRLVVPAVDFTRRQPVVFKTPHLPGLIRDRSLLAIAVGLATSAAPTYFPHAVIGAGSYGDGGLWANNPTILAYAEAAKIRSQCKRDVDRRFDLDDVYILSVGTGSDPFSLTPPGASAGIGYWGPRIVDVIASSQAQGTAFATQYIVPADRYYRVDFTVPDKTWQLDYVPAAEQLAHIGRESAISNLGDLRSLFFDQPSTPYVPFA